MSTTLEPLDIAMGDIAPFEKGHVLVVPRRHWPDLASVPVAEAADVAAYVELAQTVRAIAKAIAAMVAPHGSPLSRAATKSTVSARRRTVSWLGTVTKERRSRWQTGGGGARGFAQREWTENGVAKDFLNVRLTARSNALRTWRSGPQGSLEKILRFFQKGG